MSNITIKDRKYIINSNASVGMVARKIGHSIGTVIKIREEGRARLWRLRYDNLNKKPARSY